MIHTMKNIYKYIAFGIALLASAFALNAQDPYNREGGMATSKKVEGPEGGYYTITLESFATGNSTVTESATPVDVVLVLDVSGSMDEALYTYTARVSQSYSYSSYGNATYYYKHTDGNYYAVSRAGRNNHRLQFTVGSGYGATTWYLVGTSATTTRPTGYGEDDILWTGVLYIREDRGTKIDNLKSAVETFVKTVNHNANFDKQNKQRVPVIHNRISVVKYAGNRYYNSNQNANSCFNAPNASNLSAGNNHYGYYDYNYTEVLVGFTDVSTDDGVNKVMGTGNYTGVTDIVEGGATSADFGLYKATFLLETVKNDDSNKVVVLFTDGEPNHSSGFDDDVADDAINVASTLKKTYGATVFTIGVFDNETDDIRNYMNWTSSNYPDATGWDDDGSTTTPAENSYYQNASGANLDDIFKAVAESSSQTDAKAGASTQVRDVVSNSFILPEKAEDAQVTIKVSTITEDGGDWEEPVAATGVTHEIKTVTTTTGEQHKELVVSGFDYTLDDTKDADGFTTRDDAGNWVGERYSSASTKFWAGKKLIISFRIQANDEATGGVGTGTNHPDSGIYTQKMDDEGNPVFDDDGNPVYNTEPVNRYEVPNTPLPLLIKIKKDGLRKGESATFQLLRIKPKMKVVTDKDGNVIKSKIDPSKDSLVVDHNAIGKPKPDTHDFNPRPWVDPETGVDPKPTKKDLDPNDPMDYLEGIGWEDWSKVILTNKSDDDASAYVEKDLYGLDPNYVYMVIEDDWGWAYELSGTASRQTTSDYELNPFEFHNKPRTVNLNGDPIVKHAEAVTINHFNDKAGSGYREEHYKSSKGTYKSK